jgi:hypothetical protein
VSAEWFHVDFRNIMVRDNILRNAASYTPVTIYNPLDGSPITVYNVNTASKSAVANVDSTDPNLQPAQQRVAGPHHASWRRYQVVRRVPMPSGSPASSEAR